MIQSQNQTDFSEVLDADENVLWHGPISFNFFSSPIFTLAWVMVTGFTIWALDGYVPHQDGDTPRQQFGNLAIRPLLILVLFFQTLAMLERRALTSGRANGMILLTNRRLLRINDWGRRRVRACGYIGKRIFAIGGFLTIGELGLFVLSRDAAANIHRLIALQTKAQP